MRPVPVRVVAVRGGVGAETGHEGVLLLGQVVLDQLVALGERLGLVHLGELVGNRPAVLAEQLHDAALIGADGVDAGEQDERADDQGDGREDLGHGASPRRLDHPADRRHDSNDQD